MSYNNCYRYLSLDLFIITGLVTVTSKYWLMAEVTSHQNSDIEISYEVRSIHIEVWQCLGTDHLISRGRGLKNIVKYCKGLFAA